MSVRPIISAVDLFCGVGGLSCGLMRSGVNVVAGVDVDSACQFPYEDNISAKFVRSDVSSIESSEVAGLFGRDGIRMLAGCAPCQPFSSYSRAGRGRGYSKQWPLLAKFGRLVKDIQPELVTMENVPQLLQHDVFETFLSSLSNYSLWFDVVECQYIGVPQTRKRLVLLGSRMGDIGAGLSRTHESALTVRDAIGGMSVIPAGEADRNDSLHIAPKLSEINEARIRASKPGGSWRDWPEVLRANCHIKDSGSTFPSVYGRMEWDKPSPTITTQCYGYGNGRFGHPTQNRAISLREAALLQTFPPEYRFCAPGEPVRFNRLGRLIGNAVPVRLGEVIGEYFVNHVDEIDRKKGRGANARRN